MRIRPLAAAIAVAIIGVTIPQDISAQSIGTLIGANIATISDAQQGVDDVFGSALKKKNRIGLKGGFYLKIPMAGMFSLEPEVLYAQNGVTYESTAGSTESLDVTIGYIEVPVLLRVDISPKSHLHPMLLAGGSGAYRLQCKFEPSSGLGSVGQDCDVSGTSEDPYKKTDYSVIGGAGLAANLAGLSASLQLRVTQGVTSISAITASASKPRNRALSVLLGFTF